MESYEILEEAKKHDDLLSSCQESNDLVEEFSNLQSALTLYVTYLHCEDIKLESDNFNDVMDRIKQLQERKDTVENYFRDFSTIPESLLQAQNSHSTEKNYETNGVGDRENDDVEHERKFTIETFKYSEDTVSGLTKIIRRLVSAIEFQEHQAFWCKN